MLKTLNLDYKLIENYLNNKDYGSLASYLNKTFRLERDASGNPVQYEFSLDAISSLQKILSELISVKNSEINSGILKELFRSLRNYVINTDVQRQLTDDTKFLTDVKNTILLCIAVTPEVIQIILQFLINLIVSNESSAKKVYNIFEKELFQLLKNNCYIYEASALLYNILLQQELSLRYDLYVCILELYESNTEVEFLHFLVEKFIENDEFWIYYKTFGVKQRLIVLAVIRNKQIKGETFQITQTGVQTLTQCFVNSGNIIFQTISNSESNNEAYEVSELSQVISSLCSSEEYLKLLQNDKDLLINTGVLLINIHRLGKQSENYFSSIQSLSEIKEPNKKIYEHPAFGFKADLVRIIGNLCWKNKTMQDLTREAELIPVILDCCNMDARNPFIMQWVILAVRNLCDKNIENQKVIAGLHQEGTVSSSVLEELGLTLDSNGENSIKLVPLDVLRNQT